MRLHILLILSVFAVRVSSQPVFKTVVPRKAVVEGQPFTVQYIWQDAGNFTNFKLPSFMGLRVVNGPDIYTGKVVGPQGYVPVQNFVFTVEAVGTGKFLVPGATGMVNGKTVRSNNAVVEVISAKEALRRTSKGKIPGATEYFLRPGEDPYQKMKENLFVKVFVDKRTCFAGEPVVATYKLYSRLESRSDIIKNPGFYGFSVYDMVNLQDDMTGTELLNGKTFDVHTIRQVQLFPAREGSFVIDPMEIRNKVTFSRSTVDKNSEQEVVEGMLGPDDDGSSGSETYESHISTTPVTITVKAVSPKDRPGDFNGAVGHFSIMTSTPRAVISKNEQAFLDVTISGKGNFIQLSAPQLKWPEGIEAFPPTVIDSLDRSKVPLTGKRIFRFPFVSTRAGDYAIPSVSFSFFDPDSGRFRSDSSINQQVHVVNQEKKKAVVVVNRAAPGLLSRWWPLILAFLAVATIITAYALTGRRKSAVATTVTTPSPLVAEELLAPGLQMMEGNDPDFYLFLRNAAWQFFAIQFNLAGSGHNKETLTRRLEEKNIDPLLIKKITELMRICEEGIFTTASLPADKMDLLMDMKVTLQKVERQLHSAYL